MKRAANILFALLAVAALSRTPLTHAQVFSGDPVDPLTLLPYPMLPGLPLVLPGPDLRWNTSDDTVDLGFAGDVDLVVRVGAVSDTVIPAPSGAAGGPPLSEILAGGGTSGSGEESPFTVMLSDGSTSPTYGNVATSTALDARGAVVFGFADLDGDGVIGPTDADGSADNNLERQEADSFVGRQVAVLASGRAQSTIGFQIGAPASMGGLTVALSAGAYTGNDPNVLFLDGTPVFTLWPIYPPLDPRRVIGNGNAPPPDPDAPSGIKWEPAHNFLPPPGDPQLGTPFALPVDGSSVSTDQVVVLSGPAVGARFFEEADAASFRATARIRLRPAPSSDGSGRVLVLPADLVELAADGSSSQRRLRLLPVDALGNVADPPPGGLRVRLVAKGTGSIVSPNVDQDGSTEFVVLDSAAGVDVVVDDLLLSGDGRLDVLIGLRFLDQALLSAGAAIDSDGDGVFNDGNGSGVIGDTLCSDADVITGIPCDDNCPYMINPSQFDSNADGSGNCCDGTCSDDPTQEGCAECALPAVTGPPVRPFIRSVVKARQPTNGRAHRLSFRSRFSLGPGAAIAPDQELVNFDIVQQDSSQYLALLNSVFQQVTHNTPKFLYRDKLGSIAGVRRMLVKQVRDSEFKISSKAKGPGLIDSLGTGAIRIDLSFGDDTFQSIIMCSKKGLTTRCKQRSN